jgi:tripartite-type tricarboxylate transporter receptor subunit TctC
LIVCASGFSVRIVPAASQAAQQPEETAMLRSQFLKAGMLGALSLLAPAAARAQGGFPSRPIRLVVPFPPGGSVDPLARIVAQHLAGLLGQPVVVDNRPGGNAVIGTEYVARAPADGYTLLMAATSHVTNSLLVRTTFDPLRDFVPVATLSQSPVILVVHPDVPANSLQELIALARAQPTALNYSSAGTGNPNHLAGEMLDMMAGIRTTHVPYRGGGPAIADLLAGRVQFSFGSTIIVLPHIQTGRLRAIAVSSPNRLGSLPNVPTFMESGLPDYQIRIWNAVLAPAGTPAEVRQQLANGGMEPFEMSPSDLVAFMRADMERFAQVIRTANIRVE